MVEASTGGMAASPATSAVADAGEGTDADGRPTVELPLHITEKILCSLSPLVSARHAIVCKAWASTVAALLARPPPHLYLCTPPHASSRRGLVVSVPLDAHQPPSAVLPARVRSSDTNGMRCIGATPGGLVAFAAGWWSADVVLANPVTGALTRVAVGEPRMDPRYSRVLVAGGAGADDDAFFAVEGYKLVLWRHQGREAWSRRAVTATLDPTNNIVSAVDCGGRVYLLHEDGSLSNIDTTAPPPLRMEKLPVASLADQFGPGRLVESDGEVLFVRQLLAYKEDVSIASCTSLAVAGFEVHRLDVKAQRWVKMDVLGGDRALFVSPGSSFSVRASEVEGCRSDCIYFAGENQYYSSPACREAGETSWGVYSMEDRRVLFEHVVVTEQGTGPAEVLWFSPRILVGRRRRYVQAAEATTVRMHGVHQQQQGASRPPPSGAPPSQRKQGAGRRSCCRGESERDPRISMGDAKPSVLIPMPSRDRDRDLLVPPPAVAPHACPSVRADSDDDETKPSSASAASAAAQTGREAFHKVVHSWASKKFMTGCVILFPIAVTFYVTWWFFCFVDGFFSPIYAHLGINILGLGFVTSISFIFVVGVFMSSWLGASILGLGEWFIKRMPFVRHIYNASKQISAAISPEQNKHAFKEVVIIRHPRIGEYAFGFITSEVLLQGYSSEEQMCCVYVPTNHLYIGDIFLVDSNDVIRPNLSVREGIEIVVSGGMSMPQVLSILETEPNQLNRIRSTQS